jgi:hypothetical protein
LRVKRTAQCREIGSIWVQLFADFKEGRRGDREFW